MDLTYYFQTLLNGILAGCVYALFAMGLTLIYGVLNFVNFAHGELIMWGAYFLLLLMGEPFGLSLPAAIPPALALTGGLGLAMDTVVFRPIRRANRLTLLIAAMGLSVLLRNAAQFFWGAEVRTYGLEIMPGTPFFGVYLTMPQFAIVIVTVLCVAGVYLLFFKSRLGKSMRALSDNLDLARISGIDTKRAILAAWVISAVLAAIGGILLALDTNLSPEMGIINLIKAFAATLIGGVGNLWGALLGGLLIGLAENIGVLFISPGYKDAIAFVIMVLILLARPYVIAGERSD
ncbi:MAG TPA: branched-chain amino acid ABC transporter permease [Syntrophales bacterium]|nr:branched-chain amino acid ABC transporter permease [Syntrophales bacterium]HOX93998.1 branched-chain amino acid ABC transporter permease [Syntrophales bacterium]HPI57055.1 branched-chain amino acid ABC transporter permease [Syntrophales bacterium]HPN23815.1 branched-chain amino acid ABC transporter permease [Syntrophales bacterium]HQM30042.1 branched-chain amino acid ABC transporter permease [Syntrophales bacterium]